MLTSVKFQPPQATGTNPLLAIGSEFGLIRLLDTETGKLEVLDVHSARVGCIDWSPKSPTLLASGSKDKMLRFRDLRSPLKSILKLVGHQGEICGLAWN